MSSCCTSTCCQTCCPEPVDVTVNNVVNNFVLNDLPAHIIYEILQPPAGSTQTTKRFLIDDCKALLLVSKLGVPDPSGLYMWLLDNTPIKDESVWVSINGVMQRMWKTGLTAGQYDYILYRNWLIFLTEPEANDDVIVRYISATQGAAETDLAAGTIVSYPAAEDAPCGWLDCNGYAYTSVNYRALFQVIGTTYGAGVCTVAQVAAGDCVGTEDFNVPDISDLDPTIKRIIKC